MDNIIDNYLKQYQNSNELDSIKKYIETFNELELKALSIAISHLKTSFNIKKSIGYTNWLKNNK